MVLRFGPMRKVRIILEGLAVNLVAGLVAYLLRDEITLGPSLAIVLCLGGILGIVLLERRRSQRVRKAEAAKAQARARTLEALAGLLQRGENCKSAITLSAGFAELGYEARPYSMWKEDSASWIGEVHRSVKEHLSASY